MKYAFVPNRPYRGIIEIEYSHRSRAFEKVYERCKELLYEKLRVPSGYEILFVGGSATAAIEAALSSLSMWDLQILSEGEFSDRMREQSRAVVSIAAGLRWAAYVQFETAASRYFAFDTMLQRALLVDCVSGFGYYDFPAQADVAITTSSKILGGLPALGIVCLRPHLRSLLRPAGYYLDLSRIWRYADRNQTPHTSLLPQFASLRQSLEIFDLEVMRHRIQENSSYVSANMPLLQVGDQVAPVLTFRSPSFLAAQLAQEFNIEVYSRKDYLNGVVQVSTYGYDLKAYKELTNAVSRILERKGSL